MPSTSCVAQLTWGRGHKAHALQSPHETQDAVPRGVLSTRKCHCREDHAKAGGGHPCTCIHMELDLQAGEGAHGGTICSDLAMQTDWRNPVEVRRANEH